MFPATQGLKYYPDQPAISESESATGLVGTRVDSVAVVPTEVGRWQIPELRIPWWDTRSNELRYAVLPGRELDVAGANPAAPGHTPASIAAPGGAIAPVREADIIPLAGNGNSVLWQIASVVNGAGWLLTLAYLAWSRRKRDKPRSAESANPRERQAFRDLMAACAAGNPVQARQAVVRWTEALTSQPGMASLARVAAVHGDPALGSALDALNAALYGSESPAWDGAALAHAARRIRSQTRRGTGPEVPPLQLYPQPA
jgi:hypothetical protein